MWKNKYRIVTDNYAGYESQIKDWWFPFVWIEMAIPGRCVSIRDKFIWFSECSFNTHHSIEGAEALIKSYREMRVKKHNSYKKQKVVPYKEKI